MKDEVILQADNGNATILMDLSNYDKEVKIVLNISNHGVLKSDLSFGNKEKVRVIIKIDYTKNIGQLERFYRKTPFLRRLFLLKQTLGLVC